MEPTRIKNTTELGAIVRAERGRQGLRQPDVALAAGTGVMTISRMERGLGTMQIQVVIRVLDALGLQLEVTSRSNPLRGPRLAPPERPDDGWRA